MYRLLKDKTSQYQKKISTKTTGNPFLNKSAKFVLIFVKNLEKFSSMENDKVKSDRCGMPDPEGELNESWLAQVHGWKRHHIGLRKLSIPACRVAEVAWTRERCSPKS